MAREIENKLLSSYYLLSTLAKLLCFIVFPLFVLNTGLNHILESRIAQQNEQLYQKLNNYLEEIETFSDNSRFMHYILDKMFTQATQAEDRNLAILKLKKILNDVYSDAFTFVIADEKGNIIPELSDVQMYRYLHRITFELLNEVKDTVINRYPGNPASVNDIHQRLRRVRHILGIFVDIDYLVKPFLDERVASAFVASPGTERFGVWYMVGGDIQAIVYTSREFLQSNAGSKWIVDKLSRENPHIDFGVTTYPFDKSSFYPPLSQSAYSRALLPLARFENIDSQKFIRSGNKKFICRAIGQRKRAFACISLNDVEKAHDLKMHIIALILKISAICAFIFYTAKLTGRFSPGLRFKLAGLFIYVALIPGMIIFLAGLRELQIRDQELVMFEQNRGANFLQNLDTEFLHFKKQFNKKLLELISRYQQLGKEKFLSNSSLKEFKNQLKQNFAVDSIIIVDKNGREHLSMSENSFLRDTSILRQIARNTASIHSSQEIVNELDSFSRFELERADSMARHKKRIHYLGVVDMEAYIYADLIQFEQTNTDTLALLIIWELPALQEEFIKVFTKQNKHLFKNRQFVAMRNDTNRIVYPKERIESAQLMGFLRSSLDRHVNFTDNITGLTNRDSIGISMRGNALNRLLLALFTDRDIVSEKHYEFRWIAFLVSLLLMFITAYSFNRMHDLIITPLSGLKQGISAFEKRNFSYRISKNSENELGNLADTFNNSLENLQELEVASIVQNSLFSVNKKHYGSLELQTFTSSMTSLEGDFYEIINSVENDLCIFIGDSTGHGVPAALNMAMAKAVAIKSVSDPFMVENFLTMLNDVFYRLRRSGSKDYMTGQTVNINTKTGQLSMINAGHCFPLIVRNKGKTSEYLRHGGFPLGFRNKLRITKKLDSLAQGDSIILFTDGLIEAVDKSDIPLGFDRFAQIACDCWHEKVEVHLRSIVSAASAWSNRQQDDCTVIICRYNNEK